MPLTKSDLFICAAPYRIGASDLVAKGQRSIVHHLFKLEAEVGAVSETGALRDVADLQVGIGQEIDGNIEFTQQHEFFEADSKGRFKGL